MIQEKFEETHENEHFVYGGRWTRPNDDAKWEFVNKCMRLKKPLWFAQEPVNILKEIGIAVDTRRALELSNFFDGNLSGYYYIEAASDGSEEAIKWILGSLAEYMNKQKIASEHISRVLPADYLKAFVVALQANKFPKSFSKDVFAELLKADRFEEDRRLTGGEILEKILLDPRFKPMDTSALDAMIEKVIAENPEQAAKVVEQPKLLQYFVGQVMKQAKGSAPASVVSEKLNARFFP